ncbi:MAG: ADP-ribosylglycohydrolase family protein [Candidatus Eisenbacteria bacterium]|nr:ADP-ribosylglycohydrolase family protein [Candidatus Eisenbacteria bacterium]
MNDEDKILSRAQGALLGQLAGDSLGSLVEFRRAEEIRLEYPEGVRELADGGTWNTIAGQPTDDSEMALGLARMLVERRGYDREGARAVYVEWIDSGPFDCGNTIAQGLRGRPNEESQANGALMRISPLGVFGAFRAIGEVAALAEEDASLTHPHPVCRQANALFAAAIARAVKDGLSPDALYMETIARAEERGIDPSLMEALRGAADSPPADYSRLQGWALIAFQNAFWQLLHAPDLEEGVVDTVMRGGDTDTNAAIGGALLGAVHGREAIPAQWEKAILSCRPRRGDPRVRHPRPERYWPADALELAERLLDAGRGEGSS